MLVLTFNLMICSLLALSGIDKVEKWLALSEAGNELAKALFFLGKSDICEFLEEAFNIGVHTNDNLPMDCALILL